MPVRDVVIRIVGRDDASAAFAKSAAGAEGAAARMTAASEKMTAAGTKLTHAVTLPLLAIAGLSVKAATDFNASMTRIQTQAGATAKDVQYLTKAVLDMKNVQYGPNELAQSLYHLKSVGLENVQAMKALRISQDLAAVGGANLEDTTNALAGAWRTGIRGAKDFHQAAATVNAIIGAGNMSLADFNSALGTGILPSAKTFGLTLKDVGSALALFTDEGVDSASAATRLRMSFSLLAAPSMAAEKVLRGIGITGHQLGETMRKPDGLIKTIGLLKTHLEGLNKYYPNATAADNFVATNYARYQALAGLKMNQLTAAQRQFINQYGMAKDNHEVLAKSLDPAEQAAVLSKAFGGGRSSSAILSLINNYDVLLKKQDQVTNSLHKYDQAVKTQQATPQAQFKMREAELEKAAVILGRDLLPAATGLAKTVASIAEGFNNLSPAARGTIEEFAKWAIIIGPSLVLGGKLVSMFVTLGGAAKKAALFMSAPYRQAALDQGLVAQQTRVNQLQMQASEEATTAVYLESEAQKARATAEASVEIAASLEGTNSALAANATSASEAQIEFAAAMQAEADAAVRAAAETDAALVTQTRILNEQVATTSASAYKLQTAMAGLGIGLTVGTFTRGASTSTKLLSDLGAAAGGAAIGFSMGGPLGAAIGGLGAGLASLATQFLGTGDSADQAGQQAVQAMLEQKQMADSLLGSLRSVNGAYNTQYRQEVINQLSSKGALALAAQAGLKPSEAVRGALSGSFLHTLEQNFGNLLTGLTPSGKQIPVNTPVEIARLNERTAAYSKLLDILAQVSPAAAAAERKFELEREAARKGILNNNQLGVSLKKLAADFRATGTDLDHSAFGQHNTNVIRQNIQAVNGAVKANLNHGKSVASVAAMYERQIGVLSANLHQLHFNDGAVQKLIDTYGKIPPRVATYLAQRGVVPADIQAIIDKYKKIPPLVPTTVTATDHATPTIDRVRAGLDNLHDKTISVDILTTNSFMRANDIQKASGGFITGPGTGTSDSIPAWLSSGEYVVNARATTRHRALLDAINYGSRGYARGGAVDGRPVAGSRERRLKVAGGTLRLDLGGGRTLDAYVQDIVLAELDYAADH